MVIPAIPVRLRGPLSGLTGYGRSFCGIVKHLFRSRALNIEILPLYNTPQPSADPEILELAGPRLNVKRWGLLYGIPPLLPSLGTDYRVIYTMYEAADIPRQWRNYVKQADEIWVPCQHNAEVFGAYNSNVRVVHIGVSEAFTPSGLPKSYFRQVLKWPEDWKHKFIIGTAGVMSLRKGIDVLIQAFRQAFGEDDEVRLVIKTRDTRYIPNEISLIANRVLVIDEDWPEEKMVAFYRALDVFVLPSRGEGLGLPPLEAARCGTPVLVTAWSGPLEYIDNDGIWGIEVERLIPAQDLAARHAYYAQPSLQDLIDKLRWMRENRPGVRRSYNYWTYKAAAKRFEREILRSVWLRGR